MAFSVTAAKSVLGKIASSVSKGAVSMASKATPVKTGAVSSSQGGVVKTTDSGNNTNRNKKPLVTKKVASPAPINTVTPPVEKVATVPVAPDIMLDQREGPNGLFSKGFKPYGVAQENASIDEKNTKVKYAKPIHAWAQDW